MKTNLHELESKIDPSGPQVPFDFWKDATLVGSRGALTMIVLTYALCLAGASAYILTFLLPTAVAFHVFFDIAVDMVANRELLKNKPLRFVNELAIGAAVGWIGLLVLVFTVGIFVLSGEKGFGVAFGAGIGLISVFTPAAIVASVCTVKLRQAKNR